MGKILRIPSSHTGQKQQYKGQNLNQINGLYSIWNEKVKLIKIVAQINSFNFQQILFINPSCCHQEVSIQCDQKNLQMYIKVAQKWFH